MMRRTRQMIGCIILFMLFTSLAAAEIPLQGSIDSKTTVVFLGRTHLTGDFQGYPLETLLNATTSEDMTALPLIGSTTIENLQDVILIEHAQLGAFTTPEKIRQLFTDNNVSITSYSHITIRTADGLFPLSLSHGTISLNSDLPFTISALVSFYLYQDNAIPCLFLATPSALTYQYRGTFAVLSQLSAAGEIQLIQTSTGETIWNGNFSNNILMINDHSFTITQHPPLALFPLNTDPGSSPITLTITPSNTRIDLPSFLDVIQQSTSVFEGMNNFSVTPIGLKGMLSTASSIVNGGMILVNTNTTMTIDHTQQTFTKLGFIRGNTLTVTIPGGSSPTSILDGDCRLVFLGTHFYNTQAKESNTGVAFPFLIVFLWIIAISLFILFRYYLRPEVGKLETNIKWYALIFHGITLIVAFLLIDQYLNYLFGTSMLNALVNSGLSLFFVFFLILEIITWVLGYVLFAIPVRMITNSLIRYIGIGKEGKGIGKGVGVLSIVVFTVLYEILLINIVLSFFNFGNMFGMG